MGVSCTGFAELASDLAAAAAAFEGAGGRKARILKKGAEPVEAKIKEEAQTAFKTRTGALEGSIRSKQAGSDSIKVGAFDQKAHLVEYGHGGKAGPAAPHPFVRPGYDASKGEAYSNMRDEIMATLAANGL